MSFVAVLLTALLAISCTTEEYYETREDGAKIETYNFDVLNTAEPNVNNQWVWNQGMGRYECVFNIDKINDYIYTKGVIHTAVYYEEEYEDDKGNTGTYETLKSLPFIRTYWDEQDQQFYEETISYDVAPGSPYTICFYLQSSNGVGYGEYLRDLTFKVSLLWY